MWMCILLLVFAHCFHAYTLYLSDTHSHTDRSIRGNLEFGTLPKDTSACWLGSSDWTADLLNRPPEPQNQLGTIMKVLQYGKIISINIDLILVRSLVYLWWEHGLDFGNVAVLLQLIHCSKTVKKKKVQFLNLHWCEIWIRSYAL